MPQIPYLFTLLLTSLTVVSPAANALAKASAERNGHVLVIDRGSLAGEIDAEDDLVDLELQCDRNRSRAAALTKATLASNEPDLQAATVRALMDLHHIPPFRSNIVEAFRGNDDGPLVLIYPEHHLESDYAAGNVALQQRGTDELIALTEALLKQHRVPVNLVEYPFSRVETFLNLKPTSPRQRDRLGRAIVKRSRVGLGIALAELFGDAIKTGAVDDPLLNTKEDAAQLVLELRSSSTYAPGRGYLGILDMRMNQRGLGRFVGDDAVYAFFSDMLVRNSVDVAKAQNEICEVRSRIMADQVAAAMPPKSIGFLQTGALHVHGVRQRLRDLGVSYLILSP